MRRTKSHHMIIVSHLKSNIKAEAFEVQDWTASVSV